MNDHLPYFTEATMGMLLMREALPDRRHSWTQHVHIGGQSIYLTVGEYNDGRPGEIWVDIAKAGTFLRGVMGTLARSASIALQCGADIEVIIHMLREHDYPPNGPVQGSPHVTECYSVPDWIASELEAVYMPEQWKQRIRNATTNKSDVVDDTNDSEDESDDDSEDEYPYPYPYPLPEKVLGDYTRGSGV